MTHFKKSFSNIITLANLAFGFISILFAINKNFYYASIFILIAVFSDFLDGRVARFFRIESELGAELDSLSDLVSFGVAPAIMTYMLFKNDVLAVLLGLFVLSGAFRLARFNVLKSKIKGFVGMPITVNGVIFPALYFAGATYKITMIVVIISAVLMVSTLRFKKI